MRRQLTCTAKWTRGSDENSSEEKEVMLHLSCAASLRLVVGKDLMIQSLMLCYYCHLIASFQYIAILYFL